MRKVFAVITALAVLCAGWALAEQTQKAPDFILEGYDPDTSSHVWETNLFFSRMQEKTGVSFQFRQYGNADSWDERKKQILAGEDLPDVLFKAALKEDEIQSMYAAGVLIDLKPYLEKYAPDLWKLLSGREDWMKAVTLPEGAIPALPGINTLQNNNVLWINADWLKTLKLETPRTAGELTEVLRQFRDKDPNRNGSRDEIPLSFLGMWELRFLGHAYGMVDNDYYVSVKDGKAVSSLTSEENRQFLTWLHQLWEENLLDHSGFSNADSLRRITDDNKTVPYGAFFSMSPSTVVPSKAADSYRILQPLEWNGETVYRDFLGDIIRGTFAVTKACQEPEKLVAWVNRLYTEEVAKMAQYGLENEEYIWEEGDVWNWNADMETVANVFLTDHTIGEGGALPGMSAWEFQRKYANESVRTTVEQMAELKTVSVVPYPLVTLTGEDRAVVASLQWDLSDYADRTMACFVTGDLPLDDEHWEAFGKTLQEKGLDKMIAIWQKYIQ